MSSVASPSDERPSPVPVQKSAGSSTTLEATAEATVASVSHVLSSPLDDVVHGTTAREAQTHPDNDDGPALADITATVATSAPVALDSLPSDSQTERGADGHDAPALDGDATVEEDTGYGSSGRRSEQKDSDTENEKKDNVDDLQTCSQRSPPSPQLEQKQEQTQPQKAKQQQSSTQASPTAVATQSSQTSAAEAEPPSNKAKVGGRPVAGTSTGVPTASRPLPKNLPKVARNRPENARVFIGNLASEYTDVGEIIRVFHKYGTLIEEPVLRRSFGFVQYSDAESAREAVVREQGRVIGGIGIDLSIADNREVRRGTHVVNNTPYSHAPMRMMGRGRMRGDREHRDLHVDRGRKRRRSVSPMSSGRKGGVHPPQYRRSRPTPRNGVFLRILCMSPTAKGYARECEGTFRSMTGLVADVLHIVAAGLGEALGRAMRDCIPYVMVVASKDVEDGTCTIRTLEKTGYEKSGRGNGVIPLREAVEVCLIERGVIMPRGQMGGQQNVGRGGHVGWSQHGQQHGQQQHGQQQHGQQQHGQQQHMNGVPGKPMWMSGPRHGHHGSNGRMGGNGGPGGRMQQQHGGMMGGMGNQGGFGQHGGGMYENLGNMPRGEQQPTPQPQPQQQGFGGYAGYEFEQSGTGRFGGEYDAVGAVGNGNRGFGGWREVGGQGIVGEGFPERRVGPAVTRDRNGNGFHTVPRGQMYGGGGVERGQGVGVVGQQDMYAGFDGTQNGGAFGQGFGGMMVGQGGMGGMGDGFGGYSEGMFAQGQGRGRVDRAAGSYAQGEAAGGGTVDIGKLTNLISAFQQKAAAQQQQQQQQQQRFAAGAGLGMQQQQAIGLPFETGVQRVAGIAQTGAVRQVGGGVQGHLPQLAQTQQPQGGQQQQHLPGGQHGGHGYYRYNS